MVHCLGTGFYNIPGIWGWVTVDQAACNLWLIILEGMCLQMYIKRAHLQRGMKALLRRVDALLDDTKMCLESNWFEDTAFDVNERCSHLATVEYVENPEYIDVFNALLIFFGKEEDNFRRKKHWFEILRNGSVHSKVVPRGVIKTRTVLQPYVEILNVELKFSTTHALIILLCERFIVFAEKQKAVLTRLRSVLSDSFKTYSSMLRKTNIQTVSENEFQVVIMKYFSEYPLMCKSIASPTCYEVSLVALNAFVPVLPSRLQDPDLTYLTVALFHENNQTWKCIGDVRARGELVERYKSMDELHAILSRLYQLDLLAVHYKLFEKSETQRNMVFEEICNAVKGYFTGHEYYYRCVYSERTIYLNRTVLVNIESMKRTESGKPWRGALTVCRTDRASLQVTKYFESTDELIDILKDMYPLGPKKEDGN
jgi:hypothetical protein